MTLHLLLYGTVNRASEVLRVNVKCHLLTVLPSQILDILLSTGLVPRHVDVPVVIDALGPILQQPFQNVREAPVLIDDDCVPKLVPMLLGKDPSMATDY